MSAGDDTNNGVFAWHSAARRGNGDGAMV